MAVLGFYFPKIIIGKSVNFNHVKMKKTTTYKGVCWKTRERKWHSSLVFDGVRHNCGTYDSELEAARARDRRVLSLGLPTKLLQIYKPVKSEIKNP